MTSSLIATLAGLGAQHQILAYLFLFLGSALEGEFVLLGFSALAHSGFISLPWVIVLAAVSNILACEIYYSLAARHGAAWVDDRLLKRPRARRIFEKALKLVKERGLWLMVFSRYLVGWRIAIPAACGFVRISRVRFMFANITSAILWAIPLGLLGYFFAGAMAGILKNFRRVEWILCAILVAAGGIFGWLQFRRGGSPPKQFHEDSLK